ncbi:MAG: MarR family transcriptional regulator [Clostridia bacterium]|nr:MarR family transcriptional regulator [Clostridia bacterium]
MENDKNILMEKVMHLAMLLRRLSAPRFGNNEGPRGRSQERALTQIALRDGISQRELLEKLGIQPSSLSELLGKLERGGMIERRASEDDRRQVNLFIKESGRRYLERINDADQNLIPFDALSEEEAQKLDAILSKLIASAENACSDKGLPLYPPRPREGGFEPGAPFGHRPPSPGCHPPFPGHPGSRQPGEGGRPAERGSDFGPEGRGNDPFNRPRMPFKGEPVRLPNLNPRRGISAEELRRKRENPDAPGEGIQLADSDSGTHRI